MNTKKQELDEMKVLDKLKQIKSKREYDPNLPPGHGWVFELDVSDKDEVKRFLENAEEEIQTLLNILDIIENQIGLRILEDHVTNNWLDPNKWDMWKLRPLRS